MRAIQVEQFGGPEVLVAGDAPDPRPGAGQVLVRAAYADVLFVDTLIRSGWGRDYFPIAPPYVPGNGVAGEVIEVGPQTDPNWLGRVVALHTGSAGGSGGYAELAVGPANQLIPLSDGIEPITAAALLHDAITALGLLEHIRVQPDDWVLVTAAAGGMGVLLVQLAQARGAQVIAAARGKQKLSVVERFGPDVIVDYGDPDWDEQVRRATSGHGVDIVFDGAGGPVGTAGFGLTAAGGQFSAHGTSSGGFAQIDPEEAKRRQVRVLGIADASAGPDRFTRLGPVAFAAAANGKLRPYIGQTFPLERAADAHAAIENRATIGKTLLVT